MERMKSLPDYRQIVGEKKISDIYRKASDLSTKHILQINSTYYGGGVAEMLRSIVPLFNDVGINVGWRTLRGSVDFFQVTKKFHNALQGEEINFTEMKKKVYEGTNREFSRFTHINHDLVVLHDPQPLPLIRFYDKNQPWIWRCHVDLSEPKEEVWDYLRYFVLQYDEVIYQMEKFAAENAGGSGKTIKPAIDPLTTKNGDLADKVILKRLKKAGINPDRPLISQVSRFDKWKDPLGVLEVYKKVRERGADCQLALVGGIATDDPEGQEVYERIRKEAKGMEDVFVIMDAPDILVNVIQRASDVVLQMSKKEGFGLTATEALWKESAVVATRAGGLSLQIEEGKNGYLVDPQDYEDAAEEVLELLDDEEKREALGKNGKKKVKENFLITRLMEDWIDIWRELLV